MVLLLHFDRQGLDITHTIIASNCHHSLFEIQDPSSPCVSFESLLEHPSSLLSLPKAQYLSHATIGKIKNIDLR
jgi:hypothetical protein